jgi:hypothetical protein
MGPGGRSAHRALAAALREEKARSRLALRSHWYKGAMVDSERRVWTVGGLSHDDAGWTVTKTRELAKPEFAELERKIAFLVDLASQDDYGRLLAAVRRLDALLATAREELDREERLSPCSAAAFPLDLAAVTEAARRLEAALAAKIDAAAQLPRQLVTAFHDVRHGIRASAPYLLAYEFARRASSGDVMLVLREAEVHFEGHAHKSAREIATGLLGFSFSLVGAYLNAFHARFEEVAAELEREAAAVTDGSPSLISYRMGASGPEQIQLKNIPLEEIAALRRFYVNASAAQGPEELVQAALELAGANLHTDLHVGDVDIAAGLVGGGATEESTSSGPRSSNSTYGCSDQHRSTTGAPCITCSRRVATSGNSSPGRCSWCQSTGTV